MSPRQPSEADDARKARQAAEVAAYERDHRIVPGTARHNGKVAEGGQTWEGRTRMARARALADSPLDHLDREALDRP